MAMRWRWPPDRVWPSSARTVSYPASSPATKSSAPALIAAETMSSRAAARAAIRNVVGDTQGHNKSILLRNVGEVPANVRDSEVPIVLTVQPQSAAAWIVAFLLRCCA